LTARLFYFLDRGNDMALRKLAKVVSERRDEQVHTPASDVQADRQGRHVRTCARQQKIAERVAAGTAEIASEIDNTSGSSRRAGKHHAVIVSPIPRSCCDGASAAAARRFRATPETCR
jgi:hypothetical protein